MDFPRVKFKKWHCVIIPSRYSHGGGLCLGLFDAEDFSPVAVATVNVVDYDGLNEDEVCVKNYSENEGILEALVDGGYLAPTIKSVKRGFVTIPVARVVYDFSQFETH